MRLTMLLAASLVAAFGAAAAGGATSDERLPGTIAFTGGGNSSAQVFLAQPDGTVRQITRGRVPTRAFGWSPDGSRLLVCRGPYCGRGFFVMRLDGSLEARVPGDLPTWSPDGARLAYFDGAGVSVVGKDGRGGRRLARLGARFSSFGGSLLEEGGGSLCWASDASRVILLVARKRVGMVFAIATQAGAKQRPAEIRHARGDWQHMSVACSPTKPKVAFEHDGFIYVSNVNGTGSWRLQRGADPTWSPDGSTIAFFGDGRPMLMDADGSNVRPLDCGCAVRKGGWSPDSSMITYSGNDGGVYILNLDGSGGARVAYRPGIGFFFAPLWRPEQ